MHIISSQTSITNKLPLFSNFDILHEVVVEVENQVYYVDILAKDTLDAADKLLKMSNKDFFEFLNSKNQNDM